MNQGAMSVFDLCPDIEGLIQDELNILLKFREATKEFKLRLKLNNKSIKKYKEKGSCLNCTSRIIIHTLFPYCGDKLTSFDERKIKYKTETADIYGFKWSGIFTFNWGEDRDRWGYGETAPTHDDLNDKLEELGYKKFKSKKKQQKINLLLKH